jgi:hypothetical protein
MRRQLVEHGRQPVATALPLGDCARCTDHSDEDIAMNAQEKNEAKAQGYNVFQTSGYAGAQWWGVYKDGTSLEVKFGTEDEAWNYVQTLKSADGYNH